MPKIINATESVCDVCLQVLPDETDCRRYGELVANWGRESTHAGEHYRLRLCESCFFYALATLRNLRRTATMFDDEAWPDEEHFGRVDPDSSGSES